MYLSIPTKYISTRPTESIISSGDLIVDSFQLRTDRGKSMQLLIGGWRVIQRRSRFLPRSIIHTPLTLHETCYTSHELSKNGVKTGWDSIIHLMLSKVVLPLVANSIIARLPWDHKLLPCICQLVPMVQETKTAWAKTLDILYFLAYLSIVVKSVRHGTGP